REPWHDAHSNIEGPAAWDVDTNFTQRWTKRVDLRLLLDLLFHSQFPILALPESIHDHQR
ncbi:hypothetical protein KI387_005406, partial [Taxus chinensis]